MSSSLPPTPPRPLPGLPGFLGIVIDFRYAATGEMEVTGEVAVTANTLNPGDTVHAATVVALADTACGYGCLATLPSGKSGFTTLELKSNHVGTARTGDVLSVVATAAHSGGSTQVWDAVVTATAGERTRRVAIFRCTQFLLG